MTLYAPMHLYQVTVRESIALIPRIVYAPSAEAAVKFTPGNVVGVQRIAS